jgi:hypothetical protein
MRRRTFLLAAMGRLPGWTAPASLGMIAYIAYISSVTGCGSGNYAMGKLTG